MRNGHIAGWKEQSSFIRVSLLVMDIEGSSAYKDFVWAVEVHRLGLKLTGLWPNADDIAKSRLGYHICTNLIFIAIILVFGVPLIWGLVRVWGDLILMTENLRVTLPVIQALSKYVIVRWKRMVFLSIVNMMAEDWAAAKRDVERDVMIRQARAARLLAIFGYVIMASGFIILMIFPYFDIKIRHITNLTDRRKPLPVQTYYFYNTDKSPQFELTFLVQVMLMLLAGINYISVDAFLALVVFHICGQLENFRHRLIDLVSSKDFGSALSNNITAHLRLIRFANNIESAFSLVMFGSIFHFVIAFCLYVFLLITIIEKETNGEDFLHECFIALIITILLMQTFLYCGAGELITEQCEAMYRAMYDLEWYKLESRKAKHLIIFMQRANEPFRITAGKIIPLTMTTFCSLLKTSVGYISIMLAKRN